MANSIVNNFEIPSWAGKPPPGLHLDVLKETKMIQKLMIDEKRCYFFGRNKQLCDFCIDHASCSRVHAALVWHKHLNRPFLIDLGSTHGTFIGTIRLEIKKPQQVPLDSIIHFGASTRRYIIRERPQAMQGSMQAEDGKSEDIEGGLLGLPETESELEHLTEFNTARNRRITTMAELADVTPNPLKRKRKSVHIRFKEDEEIINPEDIDPSVGKFRNMISTTVIPTKKLKSDSVGVPTMTESITQRMQNFPYTAPLYGDLGMDAETPLGPGTSFNFSAKLGLRMPNLAPEVEAAPPAVQPLPSAPPVVGIQVETPAPSEPKKKKYAKEAWPGKKPMHSLLV